MYEIRTYYEPITQGNSYRASERNNAYGNKIWFCGNFLWINLVGIFLWDVYILCFPATKWFFVETIFHDMALLFT